MKTVRIMKHKYSNGNEQFDIEYFVDNKWYTFTTRDTIEIAREVVEWLTKSTTLVSSEVVE